MSAVNGPERFFVTRRKNKWADSILFWLFSLIVTLVCQPGQAGAQMTAEIRGTVIDSLTGEPLMGANVQVEGSQIGASTNRQGEFLIARLAPGKYMLRASYIGYQFRRKVVRVSAGESLQVLFKLFPQPIFLEGVVITASREPEKIQNAVVSVSTLSRDAMLRRNPFRLDAVLQTIPGVNLMGENVNIRNSTGYTRGLGSRVLVLLDGVPVLMSDLGNMNWDLVPVTDVERVEVVKGPASALYGSFALGGVINIITQSPTPEGRFLLRTSVGIYDKPYYPEWRWTNRTLHYSRTDFSYSRKIGNLGFRVSIGRHESTGDRENRHFQRWNGTAKLIWTPGQNSELVAFAAYARDRRGEFIESRFDHPYKVPPEYLPYRLRLDATTFYLHYRQKLNAWLQFNARASYVRQLTGNQFRVKSDFKPAQGPGANFRLRASLDSTVSFAVGLEYRYDFAEQRHFGRHFAFTVSPYLQQIWRPSESLRFTVGLRFDHYYLLPASRLQTQFAHLDSLINPLSQGKEEQYLSPQMGLSYQPDPGTVLHAAVGRGIRIPALGERFLQFKIPIEFRPNAKILTEQSLSYEIGIRQRLGMHWQLAANGFLSYYWNLIEPVYVAEITGFYATLVNIPRARIRGMEISSQWNFWRNKIKLEATATWTDPVVTGEGGLENAPISFRKGQLLSYRPRLIAFVSPSFNFGPLSIEADYAYASKLTRDQVQVYKDDRRVAKKQLDVRLLYRWSKVTFEWVVRNALQYHYTQVERNMNEVRNFSFGILWQQN